jgi:predicted RNA-binding protein with PIN domain
MIEAAAVFPQASDEPGAHPTEGRIILVDGFNVLHSILEPEEREAGWWRRQQRERLLHALSRWPDPHDVLWVAFDGAEPSWSVWAEPVARVVDPSALRRDGPPQAQVHSVYVESADDWIVRRARRAKAPERTIVATRDRQVAGRARSADCVVWSPGELMQSCSPA